MFKKLKKYARTGNWRKPATIGLLIVAVAVVTGWRLGSLIGGVSTADQLEATASSSIGNIYNNPIFAPHKLLLMVTTKIWPDNLWAARLPSLILALLFMICLYYILQRWFGRTIGLLATFMAAFSPWIMVSARLVEPLIMYLSLLMIGALLVWIPRTPKKKISLCLLGLSIAWCLYVPGMVWVLLAILITRGRSFIKLTNDVSNLTKVASMSLMVIAVAPLIKYMSQSFGHAKLVLGLPAHFPAPILFIKNFVWGILALVWRTPYHEPWVLGRLPALNIIMVSLAGFGVYAMLKLARPKAELLIVYITSGLLLMALNSNISFVFMLLPAVFVFMAAGLRYLYFEWRSVFPINPIAKVAAFALIVTICVMSMLFGLRSSLVAWPHNSDTQAAYRATIRL